MSGRETYRAKFYAVNAKKALRTAFVIGVFPPAKNLPTVYIEPDDRLKRGVEMGVTGVAEIPVQDKRERS